VQLKDILSSALYDENYISVFQNLNKLFKNTKHEKKLNNIPTNNLKKNISDSTGKSLPLETAKETIESDFKTKNSTNVTKVNAIETIPKEPKVNSEENEFKQIQKEANANSKNDEENCKITGKIMNRTKKCMKTNKPKEMDSEIATTLVNGNSDGKYCRSTEDNVSQIPKTGQNVSYGEKKLQQAVG